jgi:hypothetical protein
MTDARALDRAAGLAIGAGLLPVGCRGIGAEFAPRADVTLARFSERGYATFQAAALCIIGPIGAEMIRARRVDPARAADAWAARVPTLAGPLLQGLWLIEWGVFPLVAKWRPLTALDGAGQDRVLEDLMRSRLAWKRDLCRGMRSLALLGFYSDESARASVGQPAALDAGGISVAMSELPPSTELQR